MEDRGCTAADDASSVPHAGGEVGSRVVAGKADDVELKEGEDEFTMNFKRRTLLVRFSTQGPIFFVCFLCQPTKLIRAAPKVKSLEKGRPIASESLHEEFETYGAIESVNLVGTKALLVFTSHHVGYNLLLSPLWLRIPNHHHTYSFLSVHRSCP